VLISGGIDSAVLLAEALKRGPANPVYVACGLRWERAELRALRRFLRALRRPGLRPLAVLSAPARPLYGPHWSLGRGPVPGYRSPDRDVYLPGRNLLLLSQAAVFCSRRGLRTVLLGCLGGNPFPDSRAPFFRAFERASRAALGAPLRVRTPFARLDKDAVLRRGRGLPLELTFSCLAPKGSSPCRACNKCAERDRALERISNLVR
jgi:7-cyano-7-deazaguanine synthase